MKGLRKFILSMLFFSILNAEIKDVEVQGIDGHTFIKIYATERFNYKIFKHPARYNVLMIDIFGQLPSFRTGEYKVNTAKVSKIVFSTFRKVGLLTRLMIVVSPITSWVKKWEDNTLVIVLKNTGAGSGFWKLSQSKFVKKKVKEYKPVRKRGREELFGEEERERRGIFKEGVGVEEAKTTEEVMGELTVSVNFQNTDIRAAIQALAEYAGVSVVIDPEVRGYVTASLKDVPWLKAVETILKAHGYTYTIENNILRISSIKRIEEEVEHMKKLAEEEKLAGPLITKVYKLSYIPAEEAKTVVQKLLTDRGKIEVDKHTNSLIITDIEPIHRNVYNLIKSIDIASAQVQIEARIVDINMEAAKSLGIRWEISGIKTKYGTGDIIGGMTPPVEEPGGLRLKVGLISNYATIEALLDAYEDKKVAHTISKPRIVVSDHQKATIFGGKRVPIIVYDWRGNPITQIYEVGITLDVTPHITQNNMISLDVRTEVGDIGGGGPAGVIFLVNRAETRLLLKDGETAVIGGLVQIKSVKSRRGIPVLSSLPLIGALFGKREKSGGDREILIFLTPHIIKK